MAAPRRVQDSQRHPARRSPAPPATPRRGQDGGPERRRWRWALPGAGHQVVVGSGGVGAGPGWPGRVRGCRSGVAGSGARVPVRGSRVGCAGAGPGWPGRVRGWRSGAAPVEVGSFRGRSPGGGRVGCVRCRGWWLWGPPGPAPGDRPEVSTVRGQASQGGRPIRPGEIASLLPRAGSAAPGGAAVSRRARPRAITPGRTSLFAPLRRPSGTPEPR